MKRDGGLDTAAIYNVLKTADSSPDEWSQFVWKNKPPPPPPARVKFFAWLLAQGRIQCKTNLIKKNIVDSAICDICHEEDESPAHVIFGCSSAQRFWDAMGIDTSREWQVNALMAIRRPDQYPANTFNTFLILCCWHIWKWRNNLVFRNEHTTLSGALAACKSEAFLWKARMSQKDQDIVEVWCNLIANAM